MPVILEDEMLIPPSLRRKHYIEHDRTIEVSNGSVIELPPHEPRIEYAHTHHGQEPIIIHQDHYIGESRPTEIIREREIIVDNGSAHGSSVGRRYRVADEVAFTRRGRARSVGYDSYTDSDTESYYHEDGSHHGYSLRRRDRHGGALLGGAGAEALVAGRHHRHGSPRRIHAQDHHSHTGRHFGEAALGGAVIHKLRRRRSSSWSSCSSDEGRSRHSSHPIRKIAGVGAAALSGKALNDRHRRHERVYREGDPDPHRRARHLAEAGLGIAAVGAAKELYDHRRRSRSRSSSSSRSRPQSHAGRHIAAAALGATAAGMAAHHHYSRRDSVSSYSSDDEGHHRGRKVAAGVAGVTAAGLAAKALHDRRNRSRSSSTSSSSSGRSGRSHKMRNAALGLGAAGLAAHHHHKKQQERRSRSRSRPGILRRRSRTHSPQRHRSSSRGATLAKVAAVTMAGALAERKHKERRARSADAAERRRRRHRRGEKRVHYHNDPREYHHGDASSIHPESSVSNRPSRRESMGGVGGIIKNAIMPNETHGRPRSRSRGNGIAQEMAYRVGEGVAEGLRRQRQY